MPLEETYLGKERVTGTAKIEGTNDLQIAFADGTQRVMPERRFEAEKTAAPIDLTALRERRVQGIVKDLLTILLGWDMPLVDFEHVVSTLGLSLDNLEKHANNLHWGKNAQYDLNMSDLDKLIKTRTEAEATKT